MKIAWATDIHLDSAPEAATRAFLTRVRETRADLLLVTGDIGNSTRVVGDLRRVQQAVDLPLAFVLGNHDFYGGSIKTTREAVTAITSNRLVYLSACSQPIRLTDTCALVGVDGWGDGRVGDFHSRVMELNDWHLIAEFYVIGGWWNVAKRLGLLHALADEDAAHLEAVLQRALTTYRHVYVATHVPPFEGAAWHEGRLSDSYAAPWFVCKAVGDVLDRAAQAHPHSEITVLCGHTHSGGNYRRCQNLNVITAPARYGAPAVAQVLTI